MEVKGLCTFTFIVLTLYCVQSSAGSPRDSSVIKSADVVPVTDGSIPQLPEKQNTENYHPSGT